MHPLSLEQLTIMDVTPPELISIAAALDCQAISLYVEPPGGGIEVFRVLHGARDIHGILAEEFGVEDAGDDEAAEKS